MIRAAATALCLSAAIVMAAPHTASTAAEAPAAEGLVVKQSRLSVTETLDALAAALKDKGLTVFARIDHAENAANAGLDLPPTQVLIFGNPNLGTPLMQAAPTTAIDLPQKALAWEDADGTVRLATNDPAWLAERHGITGRDEVLEKIAGALDAFTTGATE